MGAIKIGYREAKRIIAKQEEAREVINQYRGIETLGDRLSMNNNLELILTLFEIEDDKAIIEVLTHLKAVYPDQWIQAESFPPPDRPGEIVVEAKSPKITARDAKEEAEVEEKELQPVG